jgi:hypothetical protein
MENYSEDEVNLKRYLLGELTPAEQVLVEERLFLDDEYLLRLQTLEDTLIDDYVYNELPSSEREKFETEFLSKPGRREDLRIAHALRRYCAAEAEPVAFPSAPELDSVHTAPSKVKRPFPPPLFASRPVFNFLLAASAIIILCVAAWLVFDFARKRNHPPPVEAHNPAPQQKETTEPQPRTEDSGNVLANKNAAGGEENRVAQQTRQQNALPRRSLPSREGSPAQTLSFLLLPGRTIRGEGSTKTVSFHSTVGTVILQLPLVEEDNYGSYAATLQTEGRTIHTWTGLKSKPAEFGKFVPVSVPTRLLRNQTYQINLAGSTAARRHEDIASYSFQVEKR